MCFATHCWIRCFRAAERTGLQSASLHGAFVCRTKWALLPGRGLLGLLRLLLLGLLALAGPVRAQTGDAPEAAAPAPAAVAEQQLAAADAAVDAGDLTRAQSLYDQVLRDHPQSAEAREARRALKILLVRLSPAVAAEPAPLPPEVVVRQEPYSLRTSERMRLTTWEKLDFGVTSFLYGLSVGFSYGLSLNWEGENEGAASAAMALGALIYTTGSIAYLGLARPSRGDLPLALGIASYLPTTTLMLANIAIEHPNERQVALATAGAGLVAVPLAVAATHWLDLDPGDTQLVRDAGFWGLVVGVTGTMGFAGTVDEFSGFSAYREPTGRAVALGGLAGLYGGLALGALAASQSEVSLERVRVSTWGGYGGALLGALLMSASDNNERDMFRGVAVGGLLGVSITFALTGRLDGIPDDTPLAWRRVIPTVSSVATADGGQAPAFGLMGALP